MGYLAVAAACKCAEVAVNYSADAIGGAIGYTVRGNTIKNLTNMGQSMAGFPGKVIGGFLGSSAAGIGINHAAELSSAVSGGIREIGALGIEFAKGKHKPVAPTQNGNEQTTALVSSSEPKTSSADTTKPAHQDENKTDWSSFGFTIGKAALVIGAGVGAAAFGVGVLAPLAVSAAGALPDVASALTDKALDPNTIDFSTQVAIPVVTQVAIGAFSALAGGYVTNKVIENTYNQRVVLGEKIGKTIGSYMPDCISGFFTSAGRIAGTIDAGRVAMSPETVKKAINAGNTTQQVVETTLTVANAFAQKDEQTESWKKTAAVISIGIGAAGLLAVAAPEIAALTVGAAFINAAGSTTQYIKAKVMNQQNAETKTVAEKPVAA